MPLIHTQKLTQPPPTPPARVHSVTDTPPPAFQHSLKPHLTRVGLALAFVLALGTLVRRSDFDYAITHAFNAKRSDTVATIVDSIYLGLQVPYSIYLLLGCALLVGLVYSKTRMGLLFLLTVALAWLPIPLIKALFSRPRPDMSTMENPSGIVPTDLSFPSGHTAFVSALAIALALALAPYVRRRYRYPLVALAMLTIMVVVMTAGVHFPTDTIGSMVWALAATPAIWAILTRPPASPTLATTQPRAAH